MHENNKKKIGKLYSKIIHENKIFPKILRFSWLKNTFMTKTALTYVI